MIDCPNAEIRDRLPDLLHERLDKSTRAAVMVHVDQCADCRAELALLREARVALTSGARSVEVGAIARSVIARTRAPVAVVAPAAASKSRRRRTWSDWRIAASIAVIAAGAATFAVLRSKQETVLLAPAPVVANTVAVTPPAVAESARRVHHAAVAPVAAATAQTAELSAGAGVSDLSDNDLRALLQDLESMDAVTPTDPEPVTVRVSTPGRGGGGEIE